MVVSPCAVLGFETLQALHHTQSIGHLAAEVLIRSKRQEGGVNRSVQLIWLKVEAAIARAKLFDSLDNCATRFFVLDAGSSSDAREATEMHEIQVLSVAEASRV